MIGNPFSNLHYEKERNKKMTSSFAGYFPLLYHPARIFNPVKRRLWEKLALLHKKSKKEWFHFYSKDARFLSREQITKKKNLGFPIEKNVKKWLNRNDIKITPIGLYRMMQSCFDFGVEIPSELWSYAQSRSAHLHPLHSSLFYMVF
jgi:hypothetical protein